MGPLNRNHHQVSVSAGKVPDMGRPAEAMLSSRDYNRPANLAAQLSTTRQPSHRTGPKRADCPDAPLVTTTKSINTV